MGFLVLKKTDHFNLVYEGDSAVEFDGDIDAATWVLESEAEVLAGEKPDVLVCRPLAADEVMRITHALEYDSSLAIQAAALGVVRILPAGGEPIEKAEDIKTALNDARNLRSVLHLAQKLLAVSTEGLPELPFRKGGAA